MLLKIADAIKDSRITSNDQIAAGIKYCSSLKNEPFEISKFNTECGVGVVITEDQIRAAVNSLFLEKKSEIENKRYSMLGVLLGNLKNKLKYFSLPF